MCAYFFYSSIMWKSDKVGKMCGFKYKSLQKYLCFQTYSISRFGLAVTGAQIYEQIQMIHHCVLMSLRLSSLGVGYCTTQYEQVNSYFKQFIYESLYTKPVICDLNKLME